MADYSTDRMWSDRFIPDIKRIVGPLLLEASPMEIDRKENADLIIMKARDLTIAARVRRPGYFYKYPSQFTLRSKRESGARTELEKVVDGFGDWMFYGHADAEELHVEHWMVIDLAAFRSHLIRDRDPQLKRDQIVSGETANRDGATRFRWFDADSFAGAPPLLIASSRSLMGNESDVVSQLFG